MLLRDKDNNKDRWQKSTDKNKIRYPSVSARTGSPLPPIPQGAGTTCFSVTFG